MTTRDSCLTSKKKKFNISDVNGHYSNLNLNECSNASLVHTKSNTFKCKQQDTKIVSDLINSNDVHKNLWNHKQKNSPSNYLNILGNSEDNELKTVNNFFSSKDATNNSTLSLHISAYENSVEASSAAALDSFDDKNDKTSNSQTMIKNWKNAKQLFIESSWAIQNPFEFPRQQNDKVSEPEVSQFRASQHLYNLNGTDSTTTTTTTTNVDPRAASNQIEENVNESRPQIDTVCFRFIFILITDDIFFIQKRN
uniref:Uncharacterized protein n=1 Tax=Panagrolaimus sp. PS1159 TaxID=55785 RepID=A0AC35GLF0_9BILA